MATAKTRNVLLWILCLLLAAMFLLSGSGKLANAETPQGGDWGHQFVAWGYPAWFRVIVGGSEVLAAIGLLVPRVRFFAASGLVALMLGAAGTHIANGEGALAAAVPAVLGVLAGIVAWSTRPAWVVHLLGRARRASA